MTPRQIRKILSLLHSYWPNAKALKSKEAVTAWAEAIKKFPYDDVKTAVVDYAVDNKFFPDIYDITCGLKAKLDRRLAAAEMMRRLQQQEEIAL